MPWKYDKDKITYFAATDFRGQRVKFGIRAEDRARHMYIIGKTGLGKSTLLENLAVQDIMGDEGMCFIDPHGGSAEALLNYVPEHRLKDVIYFAPFDMDWPVALNVLENDDPNKRPLIASGILATFKKVWPDAWSGRMEYFLMNTLLALLETPGSTLLGVNRMYADKEYREKVISNVTDTSVRAFWLDEYANMTEKMVAEATPAIQNKVGQFSMNPIMRNILGQSKSTFDMRWMMDNRKIFIVNLSKGRIGETNAALLGALLVTKLYLAAMSRSEMSPDELKAAAPFYLYVDEFQNFANESFADILAEARKYKLCLTVAHQYIEQMTEEVRDAIFGNVGTMITFRVGAADAEVLEKEFAPVFTVEDIVGLGFAQIYLKLMIKGAASAPFSARTEDRPPMPTPNYAQECMQASRDRFGRPRAEVEEQIKEWFGPGGQGKIGVGDDRPKTQKFTPGSRPDRPRTDFMSPRPGGSTPGAFGRQGGTPGAFGRQGGTPGAFGRDGSGSNDRPQAGGMALRDALARANIASVGGPAPQYAPPPQSYGNAPQYPVPEMQQQHEQGFAPWTQPPMIQQPMYPQPQYPQSQYAPQQPVYHVPQQPMGYPYAVQQPYYAPHQVQYYPQPMPQYPQYPPQQYVQPMPQYPQQWQPQPQYPAPYGQQPPQQQTQSQIPSSALPTRDQRREERRAESRDDQRLPRREETRREERRDESRREDRRADSPRPERSERVERGERSERVDRTERQDRDERTERQDRVERTDRAVPVVTPSTPSDEKTEKVERAEKFEKRERPEKIDRPERKPLISKNDTKGPSAERLDALSAALAKLKEKNANASVSGSIHNRLQEPESDTAMPLSEVRSVEVPPQPPTATAPAEVPHDVLRSVLD